MGISLLTCHERDYGEFFRAAGYIDHAGKTGSITSALPACDSDGCRQKIIVVANLVEL